MAKKNAKIQAKKDFQIQAKEDANSFRENISMEETIQGRKLSFSKDFFFIFKFCSLLDAHSIVKCRLWEQELLTTSMWAPKLLWLAAPP